MTLTERIERGPETRAEWLERRQAEDFEAAMQGRRPEQRQPRWLERAGKDLTGQIRTAS